MGRAGALSVWGVSGGVVRSRTSALGSRGGLLEAEQQHPTTAGSAGDGGLEERADAGITQTHVGGIPGRRGSLTTLGCI